MIPEYTTLAVGEETPPTGIGHGVEDGPSTRMYGEEEVPMPSTSLENPFGEF